MEVRALMRHEKMSLKSLLSRVYAGVIFPTYALSYTGVPIANLPARHKSNRT